MNDGSVGPRPGAAEPGAMDRPGPAALAIPEQGAHPESAAGHVVSRVPIARESERAGAVIERLVAEPFEALEAVYVLDAADRFVGAIRLPALQQAPKDECLSRLVDREYPKVSPRFDQEHVADEALRRQASSVAVVADDGRLIGAVPALSLLDILRREHVEDLHRLAGIQREDKWVRSALEAPPIRRARHRLPWLLVGLAGSFISVAFMSRFERVLEQHLAVAFFVPMVVYLSDAIGTQSEAISVRGLSLSRLPLRRLLLDELRTGALMGLTLAVAAFPVVMALFGDARLAAAVGAAIVAAGTVATTIGLGLPWLIQRIGSDPAFGSGPLGTIIQDTLSLLIYFALATLALGAAP